MLIYSEKSTQRGFSTLTRTEVSRHNANISDLVIYNGRIGQVAKTNKIMRLMQENEGVFMEICRKINRSEAQRNNRKSKR